MGEHQRMSGVVVMWGMVDEAADMGLGGKIGDGDSFGLECHKTITPQSTPRAQRKTKIKPTTETQRSRAATKKQNPPRRHRDTEKNWRKPVAPRRRGDEFNFDEKFEQKTRKFGISNTEAR